MFKKLFGKDNTLRFNSRPLTKKDAELFYTLKRYYNPASPNIAVFGDKQKFENLVQKYLCEYYNDNTKTIRINDNKIIFITGDIEVTIVLIDKMLDLLDHSITYRKYL